MGMRILCLEDTTTSDDDDDDFLADAIINDYQNLYLEDIATPGSFWLNPPYPRDDEGNKVDIIYDLTTTMMMKRNDVSGSSDSRDEKNNINGDYDDESDDDTSTQESSSSQKTEKDRLQDILDDIDYY